MYVTIERSYPDHEVVASKDFVGKSNAETSWVVEPICGRMNFLRRMDHFCTLVGIFRANRLQHALIVDHFRDGHFHVTRNEGCFTSDGRMRVSETRTTTNALVAQDELLAQESFSDLPAHHANFGLSGFGYLSYSMWTLRCAYIRKGFDLSLRIRTLVHSRSWRICIDVKRRRMDVSL